MNVKLATLFFVSNLATACFARNQYLYPVPTPQDKGLFGANLLSCAHTNNFSARALQHKIWVNLDERTLLIFDLEAQAQPRFTVRLPDMLSDEDQETKAFDDAKHVGDMLLQCAHEHHTTES